MFSKPSFGVWILTYAKRFESALEARISEVVQERVIEASKCQQIGDADTWIGRMRERTRDMHMHEACHVVVSEVSVCLCIYVCISQRMLCIYIYIYIERERESLCKLIVACACVFVHFMRS
jgi:hypothetical protein